MAFVVPKRVRAGPAITLVPMVDVMMILLIFFMVTSTYLNLDRIPAVEQTDSGSAPAAGGPGAVVMIRLSADGTLSVRGQALSPDAYSAAIAERLAADPETQFVLLPSAEAPLQTLVTAMDRAAAAGATRLKVIRLEARP